MKNYRFAPSAIILLVVGALCPIAQADHTGTKAGVPTDEGLYASERERFVEAYALLKGGDRQRFTELLASLKGYPLHDFLLHADLIASWKKHKPGRGAIKALNSFEQSSKDESLTRSLTRTLQRRLAETEQWPLFLGLGKSRLASKMPCSSLRARSETGLLAGFDEAAVDLWVSPSQPGKRCAQVLVSIEAMQTPPLAAIWERIYKGIEARKLAPVRETLKYLATRDRRQVERWLAAIDKPEPLLTSGKLSKDTVLNRRIIADLVVAWSKQDTAAAMAYWLKVRHNYAFFDDRYYETHRAMAMRGAYRRLPEAYTWLNAVDARDDDLELKEWRVRTVLLKEDWQQVLSSIRQLPTEEQEEDHWAYWEARALEATGHKAQADGIYAELAELQSYYGFLSADRLGLDYSIRDVPVEPDPEILARLSDAPAFVRAREFNRVNLPWEGRREWNNAIFSMSPEELAATAVLADRWGLHDRAIYSAGKAEQKRAIGLRFPVLYRSAVARAAQENRLDPALVMGVMRRESAYIADVQSGAGAIGLMQLMPRTAKFVADLKGLDNWRGDLTDADTNIGFGSFYLRHVLDKFNNHIAMATAGYNAGPHRVTSWLPEQAMDADRWIDTIPYTETRRYVRAVLAYTAIYEWHLTKKPRRLSQKLHPIEPTGATGGQTMVSY